MDLLQERADCQSADRAYTFLADGESEDGHLTYGELDRQARAIGAWLTSEGLKGQRALLLYPPGLDFIAAFFGCQYAEVVAVPAYPPRLNRAPTGIQAIAADAGATVALTTDSVLARLGALIDQAADLKALRWLSTDPPAHGTDRSYEGQWRRPPVTGDTLAFLQYTSGSTGTPKGVMLSHANLLHNSAVIAYAFEHTRSSSGVFWLPSYHDMGLVGGILQPLFIGRPNILMPPMAFIQKPFRWLKAISRYRATTSGGPDFAFDLCVRKVTAEERETLDLGSWTVAFSGGEPVRAETLERFAETFAPCGFRPEAFYPCYGMAEATLLVSGGQKTAPPIVRGFDGRTLGADRAVLKAPGADGGRDLVSCGQAMPDQRTVIVDPNRLTRVPDGEVGEVWVSGPSVAQGYWQRRDESDQTFRARLRDTGEGPFLRTGDLGFTHDGELFVTGRLKDLVIVHGRNHYPQDIEATVARSHPGLRSGWSAAFTVGEGPEQKLVIVLELERHQRAEAAEVFGEVRRDVGREHELVVDSIVLVRAGSIPRTSSGKIQRRACRDAFLEPSLDVVAEWHRAGSDEPIAAPAVPRREIRVPAGPARLEAARRAARSDGQRAAARAQTLEATTDVVLDVVRSIGKDRTVGLELDSSIVEMGLDSLERMEIVAALESHFGGRLPDQVVAEMYTCREVIDAVQKYLVDGRDSRGMPGGVEIPAEDYRFDLSPEYLKLRQSFEMLEATGLANPFFRVHERVANDTTVIGGRELINFSSYNYAGMSGDPVVSAAARDAIDRYGTSVSASRLVSGETGLHRELERGIADFIGVDDAIVFVGGHSTNETTVGHLFGPGDLILHDALAHNSIVQGAMLSRAQRRPFPHNDWQVVDRVLADLRGDHRRVLVAIEGVYSTDGDIPDLPRFIEVSKRHKAFLMVDEAHSAGVLGPHGRGIGEHFGVNPQDVDLWMGTLSKSFGSCGGYIAGDRAMVEYLKYTAPGFVYSVGISPANAAAALAAIRLLVAEPERIAALHERARLFLALARARGLNTGLSHDSPIVPVILGDSLHCLRLSQAMFDRGINVQPILYPAVEERAARLRFFITASHTEEQIRHAIDVTAQEVGRINPKYLRRAG
ncbi:MAG: aminotransferase class I/II-fold pyridoxal phosphate-dependent enzyme [Candidatus Rokuibacteriota bacterium]